MDAVQAGGERTQRDWALIAAASAVLLYAALAGFRTVASTDLFWTLREAQYLVHTGSIARQELFSYTAAGRPWMYPQLAGLIFYALYAAGGYAALSWLCAATCVVAAGSLLATRFSLLSCALTGLTVPLIAWRASVRADMFTTALFAVFLLILFRGTAERHPWLPALLMTAWVNLHPGFIVGLVLMAAFLGERVLHHGPVRRLLIAAVLVCLSTLVNPFGIRIWKMFALQAEGTHVYQQAVTDWQPANWSWWRVTEIVEWRDPDSAYWILLLLATPTLVAALWKHRWAMAAIIALFSAASLRVIRFEVLLAETVAASTPQLSPEHAARRRLRLAIACTILLVAGVRVFDLATNRYYFSHPRWATFGGGLSYVYPLRAADFVKRERLPGRLFHEFGMGAFLSWSLGRDYPIFMDGRAVPFGHELFVQQMAALEMKPGTPQWLSFMEHWNVQTILISLERHENFGPTLRGFCDSADLRLVYLDEVAAVFVRNVPANREWLERLGRNCGDARLPPSDGRMPAYLYYAQAAEVYHQLGRLDEALATAQTAFRLFDGDASLHLDTAQMLASRDPEAARKEIARAMWLQPSGRTWYLLGLLDETYGRYGDAIRAYSRVSRFESNPQEAWARMANCYLKTGQPREALHWFQAVTAQNIPQPVATRALLGQARARSALGDLAGAERDLRAALQHSTADGEPYLVLAEIYAAQKRVEEARAALARAETLGVSPPELQRVQQLLEGQKH